MCFSEKEKLSTEGSDVLTRSNHSDYLASNRLEHAHIVVMFLLFTYSHKPVVLSNELLQEFVELSNGKPAHGVLGAFHTFAGESYLEQVCYHDSLVEIRLQALSFTRSAYGTCNFEEPQDALAVPRRTVPLYTEAEHEGSRSGTSAGLSPVPAS